MSLPGLYSLLSCIATVHIGWRELDATRIATDGIFELLGGLIFEYVPIRCDDLGCLPAGVYVLVSLN